MCVVLPFFIPRFPDVRFDNRAKAEDDAWAAATQFYNAYQETVVRGLEQPKASVGVAQRKTYEYRSYPRLYRKQATSR
jgi:hypothetical protein